jgi:hypothetical protein
VATLNLGGIIRLTYAVKNDLGALVNPTTAVVTITQPDGTTTAPTVTLPPAVTGQLVVDFTPTQFGLHSVHWATTVPTTAEDDVFVAERPASLLVSVDEAVNHLRAAGIITSDADRETLQWLCMVATDAVERDLGRVVVRRTVTETLDGGRSTVVLNSTPVISVTTVTENGSSLTGSDYIVRRTGMLQRGTSVYASTWASGWGNVAVTYVAGYADPPRVARKVCLNVVQGMWQESQQAPHPGLDEFSDAGVFAATGALTSQEKAAYDSLRALTGVA